MEQLIGICLARGSSGAPFRTECAAMQSRAPVHSPLLAAYCPMHGESS